MDLDTAGRAAAVACLEVVRPRLVRRPLGRLEAFLLLCIGPFLGTLRMDTGTGVDTLSADGAAGPLDLYE